MTLLLIFMFFKTLVSFAVAIKCESIDEAHYDNASVSGNASDVALGAERVAVSSLLL
jgi:hypothetical protein